MKFGKYLESKQLELPEYLGHFINYKGLKKLIKQLATIDGRTFIDFDDKEIERLLQENKSTFFFRVERELEKVNAFYIEKQSDLKLKLDILIDKKNQFINKNIDNSSITFKTLYYNFKNYNKKLDEVSQFVELNESGFRKILKKWDKRSKSHLKEVYLSTNVNVQPVFHKEEINQLNDLVASSILELEAYSEGEKYSNLSTFDPINVEDDDAQTDEMYSTFLNIAAAPNNQLTLLSNWLSKLTDFKDSTKLTKVFFLAINAPISDVFLINFYKFFQNSIDLKFVDEYTNRNFLHQIASADIKVAANGQSSINHNGSIFQLHGSNTGAFDQINIAKSQDKFDPKDFSRDFLIQELLSGECSSLLNSKDNNNKIPLHYAAEFGRFDLLKVLVEKNPENVYALDHRGMTPILLAIKHGKLDCVQFLVSKEQELSDAAGKNSDGSVSTKDSKISDEIPKILPLPYACKYGNYDIIKTLLAFPIVSRNEYTVEGYLPLHIAAITGNYKIISLLVDAKLDINCLCTTNRWTPLFYSCFYGHRRTTEELVKQGAVINVMDNEDNKPIFYAGFNGHVSVLNFLYHSLDQQAPLVRTKDLNGNKSVTPESPSMAALDAIPSLSLPPPIIPLRKYGHNFLERQTSLQIHLDETSVKVMGGLPGRITISLKSFNFENFNYTQNKLLKAQTLSQISQQHSSDVIPRNVILPIPDTGAIVNFLLNDSLLGSVVEFELFPTFGTKLIAKATVLTSHLVSDDGSGNLDLPLVDQRLKTIGKLSVGFQIIEAYNGDPLEVSKYDTYWKSDPETSEGSVFSVVATSSLTGDYLKINVTILKDGTPIVCPRNFVEFNGLKVSLQELTYPQLVLFLNKDCPTEIPSSINDVLSVMEDLYLKLDVFLRLLPRNVPINLDLFYASKFEIDNCLQHSGNSLNDYIDSVLTTVFQHMRESCDLKRSIVFSSSNPIVCKVLNWKQPNFPVLFSMRGFNYSYKEDEFKLNTANGFPITIDQSEDVCTRAVDTAINFAANNNLIGLCIPMKLLEIIPEFINCVHKKGLILVGSKENPKRFLVGEDGDELNIEIENIEIDDKMGTLNGVRSNGVLRFEGLIQM